MIGLKKHIAYFPPRIRHALEGFQNWDGVTEIRLRDQMPLSLTHYSGNLILNPEGKVCTWKEGLCITREEIRLFVFSYCRGNVYRYFDTLKEGFLVDEDGYRLGLSVHKKSLSQHLPEEFDGANLRIPRMVPGAADGFFRVFREKALASTLILSPPGAGKTTLLRDLALRLSRGEEPCAPMRVCVVDERDEIFPLSLRRHGGLCDVLSGYAKAEGIRIAMRLFAPQMIVLDEIGGKEDLDAVRDACSSGCIILASAHGASPDEIHTHPFLMEIARAGIFRYLAFLNRREGALFQGELCVSRLT